MRLCYVCTPGLAEREKVEIEHDMNVDTCHHCYALISGLTSDQSPGCSLHAIPECATYALSYVVVWKRNVYVPDALMACRSLGTHTRAAFCNKHRSSRRTQASIRYELDRGR